MVSTLNRLEGVEEKAIATSRCQLGPRFTEVGCFSIIFSINWRSSVEIERRLSEEALRFRDVFQGGEGGSRV